MSDIRNLRVVKKKTKQKTPISELCPFLLWTVRAFESMSIPNAGLGHSLYECISIYALEISFINHLVLVFTETVEED